MRKATLLLDDPSVSRVVTGLAVLILAAACGGSEGGGSVSIASPEHGATVQSPFEVAMHADGLTVEPAGEVREGAGHFHLMVDADCVAAGDRIPEDGMHRHLADGASAIELDLSPGEHKLCLQAGDGAHAALDLTDEITIRVAGAGSATETETAAEEGPEEWKGTYRGTVTWDCGPLGTRRGTMEADFTIEVAEDRTAVLRGPHTVTGSCAGATTGRRTTPISVTGSRTASGFEFPSALWGPPGSFEITVTDERGAGRLTGPAPGPASIALDFDVECVSC